MLHTGFIHSGSDRIPIAGDISKFAAAHGLTKFERQLATASKRLGEDLGGTQAVRLRMGSRQFGARMVYGDCLFATISPNEQHSALVLRLSRGRPNDPYVQFADEQRQRLADGSYPSLAAAFEVSDPSQSEERDSASAGATAHARYVRKQGYVAADTVSIDLPEYDLRRAHTAQDPHAVVQAYKLEVYLRLATLFGIRMCPDCPRCTKSRLPCRDMFGSDMRSCGGTVGGAMAMNGGTEHQGHGTPHLHLNFHLASVYQHGTMQDVVDAFEEKRFQYEDWKRFHEWYCAEEV